MVSTDEKFKKAKELVDRVGTIFEDEGVTNDVVVATCMLLIASIAEREKTDLKTDEIIEIFSKMFRDILMLYLGEGIKEVK